MWLKPKTLQVLLRTTSSIAIAFILAPNYFFSSRVPRLAYELHASVLR